MHSTHILKMNKSNYERWGTESRFTLTGCRERASLASRETLLASHVGSSLRKRLRHQDCDVFVSTIVFIPPLPETSRLWSFLFPTVDGEALDGVGCVDLALCPQARHTKV